MCYNIQTSIFSFLTAITSGIVAIKLNLNILGSLILSYSIIQFSEIFIWRGINTNNNKLNKIGTSIGKYTLPSHNIAIGIGIIITYWSSKNNPIYWLPLIIGLIFYFSIMIFYHYENKSNGISKACEYEKIDEKTNIECTKYSARLKWGYSHTWYSLSVIISIIIAFTYIKPLNISIICTSFFVILFGSVTLFGKNQIIGSWWCWTTSFLSPIIVTIIFLYTLKLSKNTEIRI